MTARLPANIMAMSPMLNHRQSPDLCSRCGKNRRLPATSGAFAQYRTSRIKCQVSGAKFMLTADPTPDT
jgi:hypothetical protein